MTNELESNLKHLFGWHKLQINCLVQIILGLIGVRSVSLTELACAMAGEAKFNSKYRRLQRFFAQVKFPRHSLAKMVASLIFSEGKRMYLSIDRTNW